MLPPLLACVDADPDASGPPPAPSPAPTTTTSSPEPTPWSWPSGALVLADVTVIDASGRRGPVTVVVADGVIAAVLEEDPGPPPADAQVLDVAERTVTPGLIDPHVHLVLSGTPWWVGDTLAANLSATVASGGSSSRSPTRTSPPGPPRACRPRRSRPR